MKITHDVVFALGTEVWLKVDSDAHGIVVGYIVRPAGKVTYLVSFGQGEDSAHYDMELTTERVVAT